MGVLDPARVQLQGHLGARDGSAPVQLLGRSDGMACRPHVQPGLYLCF
jgi:hypothetical protein